jgi:hypothetical protein
MSISKTIEDKLKENRPKLSVNSVKTYVSILKNLFKKVYNDEEFNLTKFKNQDKFIKYLEDVDGSKRKTYLSALIVICNDECEKYSILMNEDGIKYNQEQKTQTKTEKQNDNWIEQDDLQTIILNLEIEANKIFKLKNDATMDQLQQAQNYILLCLVSGKYFSVRRSLEWAEMKISDFNEESNALEMNTRKPWKFIFRRYKTQSSHGVQDVIIIPELKKILNKWIKLLHAVCPDSEYLLVDKLCNKLTSVKINQRLKKIFGKNTSVNILRHSAITEKYKNMPSLIELEKNAEENGHSVMQMLEYIKK